MIWCLKNIGLIALGLCIVAASAAITTAIDDMRSKMSCQMDLSQVVSPRAVMPLDGQPVGRPVDAGYKLAVGG